MKRSMAGRLLIYEPSYAGHHLKYVQLVIRAFSDRGRQVLLAGTRESFGSAEYATLLRHQESRFMKIVLDEPHAARRLRPWVRSWNILRLAARYDCDHVFLPFLDAHFRTLGILALLCPSARRMRLEGILLDGGGPLDAVPGNLGSRVRRSVVKRILARGVFHRVLFLDEAILGSYLRHVPGACSRMTLCPDPVETDHSMAPTEFRARFGIRSDAKVLGVFGMIDARKGVDLLLQAFERYGPRSQEYLFLMGRHSPAVHEQIGRCHTAAPHIVSIDRFVTDDEMNSGIYAVDVVASLYPRHLTSASMVIRAAAAGKPTLGSDLGWIGRTIRRYDLGLACDPRNEAALAEGMRWAFGHPQVDREEAARFARLNSVQRFWEVICAEVD